MFAKIAERKARVVRAVLLLGWFVLIGSLFWDPFSAAWTDPAALASPFHLQSSTFLLRKQLLELKPYPLGNRVFWTMIVPVVPIFLLVFGHEAWRRVCPLSFASQLPRYFGMQRSRSVVQRSTGLPEKLRWLIGHDSWLEHNAWYVQFAVLFTGLTARLLIINSNRTALAVALLGVIAAAVTTGYLWDGKTWCNYFCPANIVQRIYTEPRGLLESAPHLQRTATPQSSCRTAGGGVSGGDKIACVACKLHCGDIDLERSYWDTIESLPRRNVYYMFPGLVLGFYGYYFVQAGNWDYYFSGVWTHEPGVIGHLLDPGLFFGDRPIPVPKFLAAPLFLSACVGLSLLLGRMLELAYRSIRVRRVRHSNAETINHCLAVTAFLSFNCFYLFGGRPNLALLPAYAMHAIDVLIIAVSTTWLWQTLARTPFKYRRESLAMGLVEQLRKLKVDVGQYFEGRSLDELRPDEIYVFSKVLPAVSREQRLTAYRNLLEDAISTGKTSSAWFLDVLAELRAEMGVTEAEHTRMVEEMGVAGDTNFDAKTATAQEKARCVRNYYEIVGGAIAGHVASGRSIPTVVEDPETQSLIRLLRASLQITEFEHQAMLDWLAGENGLVAQRIGTKLTELKDLAAARFCLQSSDLDETFLPELEALLVRRLATRIATTVQSLTGLVAGLGTVAHSAGYAASMVAIDGECCRSMLQRPINTRSSKTWRDALHPAVAAVLMGKAPDMSLGHPDIGVSYRYHDVVTASRDMEACLRCLLQDDEPGSAALALSASARLQIDLARALAAELRDQSKWSDDWMMSETLVNLSAYDEEAGAPEAADEIRITVRHPGRPERFVRFDAASLTIGSAMGNRAVINHMNVAPYHLMLQKEVDGLRLIRLDAASIFLNGVELNATSMLLESSAELSFSEPPEQGPSMLIQPAHGRAPYRVQNSDSVTRMLWLAASALFKGADLATLSRAAQHSELRRYSAQAVLFQAGDAADEAYFVRVGRFHETKPQQGTVIPDAADVTTATTGEWARMAGSSRLTTVQVVSDFAVILAVTSEVASDPAMDAMQAHSAPVSSEPQRRGTIEAVTG